MKDAKILSKEWMHKTLINLGFTETDTQVYVFLTTEGPQKARDIAETLNLYKQRLYRSLGKMQNKGIIKASGYPAQFSAVPIEKVIDLLVKDNVEQAEYVIRNRQDLLYSWRKIIKDNSEKG